MNRIRFKIGIALLGVFLAATVPQTAGWAYDEEAVRQRVLELQKLKEENPEEFYRTVGERKARIKSRLMELKAEDPEKFEEMKRQFKSRRIQHLKKLREEDPEKFEQLMEKRRSQLLELRQTDPARYEKIIRKHPRLARFVEHGPRPQGRARARRIHRFD